MRAVVEAHVGKQLFLMSYLPKTHSVRAAVADRNDEVVSHWGMSDCGDKTCESFPCNIKQFWVTSLP